MRRKKRIIKTIRFLLMATVLFGVVYAAAIFGVKRLLRDLSVHDRTPVPGVRTSLRRIHLNLLEQRAELYGFRMTQPAGFGAGDFLYLPEGMITVDAPALIRGELHLENIEINHALMNLQAATNGTLNLQSFIRAVRTKERKPESPSEYGSPGIGRMAVTHGTVHYSESTSSDEQIAFTMDDINIHLNDFRLSKEAQPDEFDMNGRLRATCHLRQAPFPDSRWGIAAAAGRTSGMPSFDIALRMVGIELATVAPVLPDHTARILGGDAIDLSMDIHWHTNTLSGLAVIETIAGYRYEADLSGTLSEPQWSVDSDAINYILSRSSGSLGNVLRNLKLTGAGTAGELAGTATDVTQETLKTVGSLGEGLVDTAKGIITFDAEDIEQGTQTMGSALAGGAKKAIYGAGGTIMEGVGDIQDNLSGDARADAWRDNIPQRWTNAWQNALSGVMKKK